MSSDNIISLLQSEAFGAKERLLSLLDRDPFSSTYGCFDKNYWGFKTQDFSNAAAQMSAWSLVLYNEESLLEYARAAFHFAWSLQKSDGSFDEWYPNERGWGGAHWLCIVHSSSYA